MGSKRTGVLYGLSAYVFWGFVPVYFKAVGRASPLEVLAHRVVWSAVLLVILALLRRRGRDVIAAFRDRATLLTLAATSALIATNWYVFIWAVDHELVLQSSLGYFINPLVSVLLGFLFLRERLRPAQQASVALALAAVAYLAIAYGEIPHVSLLLALSFGFYGLLRKRVRADALAGLTAETLLLFPAALALLVAKQGRGTLTFLHAGARLDALLPLAGIVTAVPLLWYANAVRRLRLATVGFLQYTTPSLHFLLAVVAYQEPFTRADRIAFGCIWAALGLYSIDTLREGVRLPQKSAT